MTTVVNLKYDEYDVYIGRGSKWGNPYSHLDNTLAKYKTHTRSEAIRMYESYVLDNEELLLSLNELVDKRLGCFCKRNGRNVSCHGDILKALVEIKTDHPEFSVNEIVCEYTKNYIARSSSTELF